MSKILLKKILDGLTIEQKRQLFYAFENEFSQHVKLPGGKFIGVNITPVKYLKVEESVGKWAYGTIKGANNEDPEII